MIYVYWIHHESQKDPKTEGYIGVTNDPETRLRTHKRSKNLLVASNISKGAVLDILHVRHNYADAYALEESYRPDVRGWNLAKGGLGGVGSSMPDGWHSERNHKRYADPEQRTITSNATKRSYEDPAVRKKTSDAMKKVWQDPEYQAKQKHKPGNFCAVVCEGVSYESVGAACKAYGKDIRKRLDSPNWPDFYRTQRKRGLSPLSI